MPAKYQPTHSEIQREYHVIAKGYAPEELEDVATRKLLYKRAKAAVINQRERKALNTKRNATAIRTGFMDAVDDTEPVE